MSVSTPCFGQKGAHRVVRLPMREADISNLRLIDVACEKGRGKINPRKLQDGPRWGEM